ncbi:ABC transporter permease [Candidatus Absconditicoccus praedator]|uniref:ABC transporter permease n=1 Tax=Candidatus Absconditicoccus praedator TaxID=2735562 RepID=UPI001E5ECCFE|nr:hypothetical protein [Candidatus Absconditicoccus praedator]UFX82817.1 ABC transporter permease [Candidatus Absconditicoccus praedator]
MYTIAKNTFKEFIRNKILYTIIGAGVVLILGSIVLSTLAVRQEERIIINSSLTVIEIFGLIVTLFMGSYLLYSELSKNTILMILSKAPSRANFILGKFLGFSGILFVVYLLLGIAFAVVLFLHSIAIDLTMVLALFFSFLKILFVLGFIVFFSTFVSPFVSLLASLSVYIIGHSTSFIKYYMIESGKVSITAFGEWLVNIIYFVFPNFTALSIKEILNTPLIENISNVQLFFSVFYTLIYVALLLILSIIIFNNREF